MDKDIKDTLIGGGIENAVREETFKRMGKIMEDLILQEETEILFGNGKELPRGVINVPSARS